MLYTAAHLLADLQAVQAADALEKAHIDATVGLLEKTPACFHRTDFPGHVTGSAWLVSPDGNAVLLTHHIFLDRWLQFGGHADGDPDTRAVAMREAEEESGITGLEWVNPAIFDVDVHAIPANAKRGEPAHLHYDIRYLLRAKTLDFTISPESKA